MLKTIPKQQQISLEDLSHYKYHDPDLLFKQLDADHLIPINPKTQKPYVLEWYQKIAIFLAVKREKLLISLDAGTGKTLVAIMAIKIFIAKGMLKKKILFVTEGKTNSENNIPAEFSKFAPDLSIAILNNTNAQSSFYGIDAVITHYKGIESYCSIKKQNQLFCNTDIALQNQPVKWETNKNIVKKFIDMFGIIILDECQNVKNPFSLRYKTLAPITKEMQFVLGLSATPANDEPIDVYSVISCINHTIFKSYANFVTEFVTYDYIKGKKGRLIKKPTFKTSSKQRLERIFRHIAFSVRKSETGLKLPELKTSVLHYELRDTNRLVYAQATNTTNYKTVKFWGKEFPISNSFAKLLQICSGFSYTNNEDAYPIYFPVNPKKNLLKTYLTNYYNENPKTNKVVIFYGFNASLEIIKEVLEVLKIPFISMKEPDSLYDYLNSPHIPVLISNYKSGGVGLNLQIADTQIYFEIPLGAINHTQANSRLHRLGSQHNTVNIVYLVGLNTIEESTLDKVIQNSKATEDFRNSGYIVNG